MPTTFVDISGLPEPIVQAIQQLVRTLRAVYSTESHSKSVELPKWDSTVIGTLSRRDLYDEILSDSDPEAAANGNSMIGEEHESP